MKTLVWSFAALFVLQVALFGTSQKSETVKLDNIQATSAPLPNMSTFDPGRCLFCAALAAICESAVRSRVVSLRF
jgi:hypothetical protein